MAKNKGCGCFPLLILLGAAGYGGYYWYDKNQQSSEAEAQELSAKEQKTIELRNAEKAAKEAEASAQKAIEEARLAEENANKAKAEAQKLLEEAQQAEAKARTAEADAKKTAEEAAKAAEEAAAKNAEEISQSEPDSATAALDDSTAEQSAESSATETIEPEPEPPNPLYGLSAEQIRELGVDYAEGRNGKSVDEQEAIRLYLRAADMGDIKAQRWMGWRYRQGRGVPKDEQLAYAYFLV